MGSFYKISIAVAGKGHTGDADLVFAAENLILNATETHDVCAVAQQKRIGGIIQSFELNDRIDRVFEQF